MTVDTYMQKNLRGHLRQHVAMAGHATWRAGGAVACAYFPADLEDLSLFLAALRPDEPVLCVGLGSNLLVRDGGFAGTALFLQGALGTMTQLPDGRIYAEAGVACAKLARFAARVGQGGAAYLAGIPGTLGGALAMNAGCHGETIWNHVAAVLMLNRQGVRIERKPEDFAVGYRHVGLKAASDEIFAGAWLSFPEEDPGAAQQRMREFLARRSATQPLHQPNAGSVFRNPPGDFAARLIEAAGLKGCTEGGAMVSEKHANFIVNPQGKASATAIETLIRRIQAAVQAHFGVMLRPEVRIVGTTSG